jgi:hypothetical protein
VCVCVCWGRGGGGGGPPPQIRASDFVSPRPPERWPHLHTCATRTDDRSPVEIPGDDCVSGSMPGFPLPPFPLRRARTFIVTCIYRRPVRKLSPSQQIIEAGMMEGRWVTGACRSKDDRG